MNLKSIIFIVWIAVVVFGAVRVVIMIKEAVQRGRDKATASKSILPTGQEIMRIKHPPVSPEEAYYVNVCYKKGKIPTDALQRSKYVAWLLKEEFYEEADRVLSMKI